MRHLDLPILTYLQVKIRLHLLNGNFDEVLNELSLSGAKEVVVATSFDEDISKRN